MGGLWLDVQKQHSQEPKRFHIQVFVSDLASIPALFTARRPAAIIWRVWPVIVRETINGVLGRWAWSHVGKEGREIIAPSVTHGYAASAPIVISRPRHVVATLPNTAPCREFRGQSTLPSMPVCDSARPDVAMVTPATLRMMRAQMPGINDSHRTAVTFTRPITATAATSGTRDYGQASEAMSN